MARITNPYHEFLRKVYRMRKAQKAFFQDHLQKDQRAAMDLEKEVDRWLESVGFQAAKVKQLGLSLAEREQNENH